MDPHRLCEYLKPWQLPRDIIFLIEERAYHDLNRISNLAEDIYETFVKTYINPDILKKETVLPIIVQTLIDYFGHNIDEYLETYQDEFQQSGYSAVRDQFENFYFVLLQRLLGPWVQYHTLNINAYIAKYSLLYDDLVRQAEDRNLLEESKILEDFFDSFQELTFNG